MWPDQRLYGQSRHRKPGGSRPRRYHAGPMSFPTLLRARHGLLISVVAAGAALAGCGASDSTSTSSVAQASSSDCAAACSVSAATPAAAASPAACTNKGSGRTDDFKQAVTLTTLSDGLKVGDISVGTGAALATGQTVTLNYTGWLSDGTVFDSSRKAGASPLTYPLGSNGLIKGFEEALSTMKVGGIRRAVIPPALGYGSTANGPIPANSTITFDIEVLCAG